MIRTESDNLLDIICSKENLMLAWRRVENSLGHGNIWYDELELAAYKFNLVVNLDCLSEKLLDGSYRMRPIMPAPYPKSSKITKRKNGHLGEEETIQELRVRQSFAINIEDQLVWMAVCGVVCPFFEEEMPAWSYGNRLYLNGWRNEKGRWINGVYRTTSVNFYRKWAQGWPLYRHSLAVCIKKMAFPKDKVQEGERYTSEDMLTIEENDAQVNNAFKLKYLEKNYFGGEKKDKLYYIALDLEKFYPSVEVSKIRTILKNRFVRQSQEFYSLIDVITDFKVGYGDELNDIPFTDAELEEMNLSRDVRFVGLPTGLIVAGALANIFLLELDKKVVARLSHEAEHHIMHFRYVDDHLMLSDDKGKLDTWKKWYINELVALGLRVNTEKTEEKEIDSHYPTPLLTQTLHKISEIARQPLDLLNSNEFSMVYRDLQMLLVTDFPEQEIKKSTRTSFACTMLSRLASDVDVDYDEIHQLRQKWLSFVDENFKEDKRKEMYSLIFTSEKNYPELDEGNLKEIKDDGKEIYKSIRNCISESIDKIRGTQKKIFNLLVYALKETPDKPSMWLKVMDFCVSHAPNKLEAIYKILNMLRSNKCKELHSLGHEYIWASLNIHLALRIIKAIYRHSIDAYKNPIMKEGDLEFLKNLKSEIGTYKGRMHYLIDDSMFILYKAKQLLAFYNASPKNVDECRKEFLEPVIYHGISLDASFWLLWSIERLNYGNPQYDLKIPKFIIESLPFADQKSPYFLQLFYTCISQISPASFSNIDIKKLKLSVEQQDNILLSAYGKEHYKDVLKMLELKKDRLQKGNSSSKITLLEWIKKVRTFETEEKYILDNVVCSEYAATFVMKSIVKFFKDNIEHLEKYSLHPAAILLKEVECLKDKKWEIWLSDKKKIQIKCLRREEVDDTRYRYLSSFSNNSEEWGVIYGLGIIFLQVLTKEYTMPWVFNRPEYGFEWESVLKKLLAKGRVSTYNYQIVSACLSLEDKETMKLKRIMGENVVMESPLASNIKIVSLEDLLSCIEKSLNELKENQISVGNHETRQLVMIKLKS